MRVVSLTCIALLSPAASLAHPKVPASAAVDFSACANVNRAGGQPVGVSVGNTTTKDAALSFYLLDPSVGNNAWSNGSGASITVSLSVPHVTAVNMLLNSAAGQGGVTNATVILHGTDNVHETISLVGDETIRDWNNSVWTNSIDNTKAQEWWTDNPNPQPQDMTKRLDAHVFKLSGKFAGQTLTGITVQSPANGAPNFMEPLLWAISVVYRGASGTVRSTCTTQ